MILSSSLFTRLLPITILENKLIISEIERINYRRGGTENKRERAQGVLRTMRRKERDVPFVSCRGSGGERERRRDETRRDEEHWFNSFVVSWRGSGDETRRHDEVEKWVRFVRRLVEWQQRREGEETTKIGSLSCCVVVEGV